MSEHLRVRVYDVRFGDAILVSIPDLDDDGPLTRHLLIDVGTVLSGAGGVDDVLTPVVADVARELDGRPLDLYVMTHEHLDHVQGLLYAHTQGLDLPVDTVWMTASAEGDAYYDRHPDARRKRSLTDEMYDRLSALTAAGAAPELAPLMLNNDRRRTADCIRFIREELTDDVHYVHREIDIERRHPFRRARLSIWAPEEDTADYHGRLQPLTLGAEAAGADDRARAVVSPPPGVDVDAFYNLLALRNGGIQANALAIDRAANDTSVVLLLEWDGWRLLFAGDAEHRSWRTMAAAGVLGPVDFVKVAHHGSENGTPTGDLLDRILPMPPPDPARPRYAVVSTCRDSYPGVPDDRTLSELERRCTVLSTLDAGPGGHFDVTFAPG